MAVLSAPRSGLIGRGATAARAAPRSRAVGVTCRAAKITLLPGDGIGPEITKATVNVLMVR